MLQRKGGIGEVCSSHSDESDHAVPEAARVRRMESDGMESDRMVSSDLRTEPLVSPLSVVRYWGPVCLYAGLIFVASSMSSPPESVSSILGKVSDKVLHLCEYALLGAFAYRACRHGAGAWVAGHAVVVAVAGCALYGLSDEIHQLFVPLRQGDPLDLVADSVGAMLGAWTWRLIEGRAVQLTL